jgi:glycosyltransferase involved in cell wall biosynthesis
VDVALLKSWDFGTWRAIEGHGWQLPYRLDYLEDHGLHLRWTDALYRPRWQASTAARAVQRMESIAAPFAQAAVLARTITDAPITLAMFESEANIVAMARSTWPGKRASILAVVACWLAEILPHCSPTRRAAYRWAYRSVDRIFYFSENQRAVLAEQLAIDERRLRYVPFGIDHEAFSPTGEDDGDYVLVVGRDGGRDWSTLLAALGGLGLPVKVCCRTRDLDGHVVPAGVEVLGYVDRSVYRSLLGRARVVAVASRPVAYPSGQSVLLEAMAMGRAVVVTETPALADYIDAGTTALAVPPGDPAALREQVLLAAGDESLRRRLGAGGRTAVEDRFNARAMWRAVAGDLLSISGGRGTVPRAGPADVTTEAPSSTRRCNVLLVAPTGDKGGAEGVLCDLAFKAETARFRPFAICLRPGVLPRELARRGIPTLVVRLDRLGQVPRVAWVAGRIAWVAHSRKADLIHANGTLTVIVSGIAGRISRTPVVWHVYDAQSRTGLRGKAFFGIVRLCRPAWIIFATDEARTRTLACCPSLTRYSTIYPGVSGRIAQAPPGPSHPAIRALGEGPILAMFARMDPRKGHEDLLRAVAILRPRYPTMRVAICGDWKDSDFTRGLRDLAGQLGIADAIWFAGYVPDELRDAVLDAATVVVHPAVTEPFGLAVVEAMAAGKPVVVADAEGPSLTVTHGVNGLVYPKRDPAALAHTVDNVLRDPELARRLGEAGRRRAADFSAAAMVQAVEGIWSGVIGGAPRSSAER